MKFDKEFMDREAFNYKDLDDQENIVLEQWVKWYTDRYTCIARVEPHYGSKKNDWLIEI